MATFNGGRMVALFLCMLFANASFAQDDWETIVVYMEDPFYMEDPLDVWYLKARYGPEDYMGNALPDDVEEFFNEEVGALTIREEEAPGVTAYKAKWNDPLTWETFEDDFTPAREDQIERLGWENGIREKMAELYLKADWERWTHEKGTPDTTTWYPSWIPLARARSHPVYEDSLFTKSHELKADATFDVGGKAGQKQNLFEWFFSGGGQPNGIKPDGGQAYKVCKDGNPRNPRCRKNVYSVWLQLVEKADVSNVISFTVKVKSSKDRIIDPPPGEGFTDEIEGTSGGGGTTRTLDVVEYDYDSIRLLQPAAMLDNERVIDTPPYATPAAKPVSSAETSSWGRIKATFADD